MTIRHWRTERKSLRGEAANVLTKSQTPPQPNRTGQWRGSSRFALTPDPSLDAN
jgi:hypothetical protein